MPDLRIHRLATFSLRIDDYGNEASLVTLTYTLFARSRSRSLCHLVRQLYTLRSSDVPNHRDGGFISGAYLLKLCGWKPRWRRGCLGNCRKDTHVFSSDSPCFPPLSLNYFLPELESTGFRKYNTQFCGKSIP